MPQCKICKKQVNKADAYIIINDKKIRNYYCSKEEYDTKELERALWVELYEFIRLEILFYDKTMILPTTLVKELWNLRKHYDFKTIIETFRQNKDVIIRQINYKLDLNTEYKKISYIMAIIKNNINDIYLQEKSQILTPIKEIEFNERNINEIKKVREIDKGISDYLEGDI